MSDSSMAALAAAVQSLNLLHPKGRVMVLEQSCRENLSKASFQLLKTCKNWISPPWFPPYKTKLLWLMACNLSATPGGK